MSKDTAAILNMLSEIETEQPLTVAHKRERAEKTKKTRVKKVYTHLKPREAKALEGTKRKEIILTLPIIEKLQRQADRKKTDLKKYMEKVLIKAASNPRFDVDIV